MKSVKRVLVLLSLAFVIGIGLFPSTSFAGSWGKWNNTGLGGDCRVAVWTDLENYLSNSTTIDYIVGQTGSCGTLYYTTSVNLYDQRPFYHVRISPTQTGYFNNQTPMKSFRLNDLTQTGVSVHVKVDLYKDAAKTRYIGHAYKQVYVGKR